jgi:hypothetical protein
MCVVAFACLTLSSLVIFGLAFMVYALLWDR